MNPEKKPEYLVFRRNNLIMAFIVLAIFIVTFASSFTFGKVAARMPKFIAIVGMVVAAFEVVSQISAFKGPEKKGETLPKVENLPWYYTFAAIALYILLMYWFGFIISNLVFLFAMPMLVGHKEGKGLCKWKSYLIFSVALTALLYISFVKIFYIRLPAGILLTRIMGG